jgi:hypothetical protein
MRDTRLEELYNKYLMITDQMVAEYDAMEVAAIMMAQALSIYRTGLDEIDYHKMVDSISSNRDNVKKFTPTIIQ